MLALNIPDPMAMSNSPKYTQMAQGVSIGTTGIIDGGGTDGVGTADRARTVCVTF